MEITKGIGSKEFSFSVFIKENLMKLNRYSDYLNGYKKIDDVRKRFNLSPRRWDNLLAGNDNIPLSVYQRVLAYVRSLKPSNDLDMNPTETAIESFKDELTRNHHICVNK